MPITPERIQLIQMAPPAFADQEIANAYKPQIEQLCIAYGFALDYVLGEIAKSGQTWDFNHPKEIVTFFEGYRYAVEVLL